MSQLYKESEDLDWMDTGVDRDTLEHFWASVPRSSMHKLLTRWFIFDAFHQPRHANITQFDSIMDDLPDEFARLAMRQLFEVELPVDGKYAFLKVDRVFNKRRG